jgi:hypothetical protein
MGAGRAERAEGRDGTEGKEGREDRKGREDRMMMYLFGMSWSTPRVATALSLFFSVSKAEVWGSSINRPYRALNRNGYLA